MPTLLWLVHPFGPIGPMAVRTAELDDAYPDVVVAAHSGVHVLRGPDWRDERISTDAATDVELADIDGDGDVDIAAAHYFADTVSWYENTAAGFTRHDMAPGLGPFEIELVDVDGSGSLDILATLSREDAVVAYRTGGGSRTVLDELEAPRGLAWNGEPVVVHGDGVPAPIVHHGFDGGPDLLLVSEQGVSWLQQDKMHRDGLKFRDPRLLAELPGIVDLDLGDVSGDGKPDIVVATDRIAYIDYLELDVHPLIGPPRLPPVQAKRRCGTKGERLEGPTLKHLTATAWYDAECREHPLPDGLTQARAIDMDGDGDLDLVGADRWYEQGGEPRPLKADIVDAPVRVSLPQRDSWPPLATVEPVAQHDPGDFCPSRFPANSNVPRETIGMFGKQMKVSSRWERLDNSAIGKPDELRLFFITETLFGGTDDLGHPMGGEGVDEQRHVCSQLLVSEGTPVAFLCTDGIVRCDDRVPVIVRDGGAGPQHTERFAHWLVSDERIVAIGEPAQPVEGVLVRGLPAVKGQLDEAFRGVRVTHEPRGLGEVIVGDVLE